MTDAVTYLYAVGDRVIYTNEFGVCFGVKTITALDTRTYDLWSKDKTIPVYIYEGMDTPWCGVKEDRLQPADEEDLAMHGHQGSAEYFFQKYGRLTTREELASLLDNDPFDGED